MKNKKILFIVLVIVALAGIVFGAFVLKNINDKPAQVVQQKDVNVPPINTSQQNNGSEQSSTPIQSTELRGLFKDADAVHSGTGVVEVVQSQDGPLLVFGNDFKVTNGPDLFVYLSPNPAGQDLGAFASLGKLKSISGTQAYTLPQNYRDYKTVVIWCRAFSVTFATAELQ
jgi:hypothetical protein